MSLFYIKVLGHIKSAWHWITCLTCCCYINILINDIGWLNSKYICTTALVWILLFGVELIADNLKDPLGYSCFTLNFDMVILFLISFSGSYLRIDSFLLKNWKSIHVNSLFYHTFFRCGKWCFPYLEERETETRVIFTSKVISSRNRA